MGEFLSLFFRQFSLPTLATIAVGYLLGSINFSIIITKLYIRKDIRNFGSGNAGATNVLRSVGTVPALFTFAGDFAKQVASILLGRLIFTAMLSQTTANTDIILRYAAYLAGISCFLGHIYPVFFRFRGGKGVTTAAALMALIDWRVFLIELIVFLIVMLFTRIVSLGSVLCGILYPITTFCIAYFVDYRKMIYTSDAPYTLTYVIVATCLSALIGIIMVIKHHANITRILNGTEKPISFKR